VIERDIDVGRIEVETAEPATVGEGVFGDV
jgi:hypothetical protein